MQNEVQVAISSVADIVTARVKGRGMAVELGFDSTDLTLIATAISEVSRNIIDHARSGQMIFSISQHGAKRGLQILARDETVGINVLSKARPCRHSSAQGSGVELPEAKWVMDEFDISSKAGKGTVVTMKKWLP